MIIEGSIIEGRGEALVDENGNFPENEGSCVDVLERVTLFVLDGLSEGTDNLAFRNLDREDVTGIITEHQTVEIEMCIVGHSGQGLRGCG